MAQKKSEEKIFRPFVGITCPFLFMLYVFASNQDFSQVLIIVLFSAYTFNYLAFPINRLK